jgi:hypothetical protein
MIYKTENNLTFSTYQKPNFMNTIIHSTSCHPIQHKLYAINFTINRLNTHPMKDDKNTEKT